MSKSDVLAAIHDLQTSLNHHFLSTQMLFHQFITSMDTHLAHLDSSIPKSEFPISSSSSQIWNSSPTTQDPLSNFTEIPLSPPSLSFHSPHPLASPPTPLLISFSSCSFPSPPPSPVTPTSHHQILISPSSPQSFSITTALGRTKPFPQPLVATPSLSRSAHIGDVVTVGGISSLHSTPASPPASRLQPPPPPTPPPPIPPPPTDPPPNFIETSPLHRSMMMASPPASSTTPTPLLQQFAHSLLPGSTAISDVIIVGDVSSSHSSPTNPPPIPPPASPPPILPPPSLQPHSLQLNRSIQGQNVRIRVDRDQAVILGIPGLQYLGPVTHYSGEHFMEVEILLRSAVISETPLVSFNQLCDWASPDERTHFFIIYIWPTSAKEEPNSFLALRPNISGPNSMTTADQGPSAVRLLLFQFRQFQNVKISKPATENSSPRPLFSPVTLVYEKDDTYRSSGSNINCSRSLVQLCGEPPPDTSRWERHNRLHTNDTTALLFKFCASFRLGPLSSSWWA